MTITERQEGNAVHLEVHVPKSQSRMGWNGTREIKVELRVPRTINSFIHTGDGWIRASGLEGKLQFQTGDGSIEAIDVEGVIEAHTGDGHIRVKGRFERLDLETGDGSIEAELGEGSRMNAACRMHTGDGHVTVRLPRDLHITLDAHTGDGSLKVGLPLEDLHKSSQDLKGKLNGGGQTLTIRTGDGGIDIESI